MTYIKSKKINKEARRHKFMVRDLENAVEAIDRQNDGQYVEASMYKDAIKYDTRELWEVAGDVVQFCKDAGEYIGG